MTVGVEFLSLEGGYFEGDDRAVVDAFDVFDHLLAGDRQALRIGGVLAEALNEIFDVTHFRRHGDFKVLASRERKANLRSYSRRSIV